jgi:hypothetical protein
MLEIIVTIFLFVSLLVCGFVYAICCFEDGVLHTEEHYSVKQNKVVTEVYCNEKEML